VKLTIYHVETKDEGVYKCKVENQEGVASTTGYLCVIAGEYCRLSAYTDVLSHVKE